MKTKLLLLVMILLPLVASAHDIEVKNADGVTIYYNYVNNNTELAVTYRGPDFSTYSNEYIGVVVIPSSVTYNSKIYPVTSIGNGAFYYCSVLTSVTIPNSVTSIGNSAFSNCSGLTSIEIPNSVTSIGNSAFQTCSGLTSIEIPNSVTSIGSKAFLNCTGLQKVIVKDIAAWCNISFKNTYANPLCNAHHLYSDENTEITNLVIPNSVTSIGKDAFTGCSGLTSITIPNSVTSIGGSAFYNCSALTSVTIGNSVTSIGGSAFHDCTGLTSIIIPNSVTSIGSGAFSGCSGLTSIVIPNSVTSIGYQAFENCTGLTSVEIPNSVTSIGDYAFNCSGLTSVIVEISTPLGISENTFTNRANATLYVPAGSKAAYQATDYWKQFKEIVEIDVTGIIAVENEQIAGSDETGNWYTLDGRRLSGKPTKRGIYIVNGRKVIVN